MRWWDLPGSSFRLRPKDFAVTVSVFVLWAENEAWCRSRELITARISGLWLGPLGGWLEAAQSHPLNPTGHGGRRPPVTHMEIPPGDFGPINTFKINN